MKKWVEVKMIHSPIARDKKQLEVLKGLGLRRCNNSRWLEDTPAVRGMVNKIPHLAKIVGESTKKPA